MSDFEIKDGVLVKYTGPGGEVEIPNSVTTIGHSAFIGCLSLTGVAIPNSVTAIGTSAFSGCKSLEYITIPDSVVSIDSAAFLWCQSLKTITLPDSVTFVGNRAFKNCKGLADESGLVIIHHVVWECDSTVTNVVIPDGVTAIGNFAFERRNNIKSVTMPDSVTSIGDHAFTSCENLISVTLSNSLEFIGERAFAGCRNLESISFPKSVTFIGKEAFLCCEKLQNVFITHTVPNIGECAFQGCLSLANSSGLVIVHHELCECRNDVVNVTIPDHVTAIAAEAFRRCKLLKSVVIPESVTSIGRDAFTACESLQSVIIPKSVAFIGPYAFSWCPNLTKVTLAGDVVFGELLPGECSMFMRSESIKYVFTDMPTESLKRHFQNYKGLLSIVPMNIPPTKQALLKRNILEIKSVLKDNRNGFDDAVALGQRIGNVLASDSVIAVRFAKQNGLLDEYAFMHGTSKDELWKCHNTTTKPVKALRGADRQLATPHNTLATENPTSKHDDTAHQGGIINQIRALMKNVFHRNKI